MYKVVAIDLDGTLLNSEKKISQENKQAIKLAMEKGIKIVVCSGRIYTGARAYARELGINDPLIACNGAIIRDLKTGKLLYSNTMNKEDCFKVIDICQNEDIYCHAYIGDTMYTEKLAFSSLFYSKKNKELPEDDRVDIILTDNLKKTVELSELAVTKFVIIDNDQEKLMRTRRLLEKIPGSHVMSSNINNIEVVNRDVEKGNALEILTDKLGIQREHVMAIGDNENDKTMLDFAGLGIAMGNAENYIKDMADFITMTNNENGVAHAINKFILAD